MTTRRDYLLIGKGFTWDPETGEPIPRTHVSRLTIAVNMNMLADIDRLAEAFNEPRADTVRRLLREGIENDLRRASPGKPT